MAEEKRITVRVSPKLYEQVAKSAEGRNLSINAFVIDALETLVSLNSEDTLPNLQSILERVRAIEKQLKEKH